jgi:hypothetical protein
LVLGEFNFSPLLLLGGLTLLFGSGRLVCYCVRSASGRRG